MDNHHYSQDNQQDKGTNLSILNDSKALTKLAKEKGFQRRERGPLTPMIFLVAMIKAAQSETLSLRLIAVFCGLQMNETLAKQSLWERVTPRAFDFLSAVLCRLMTSHYQARQFLTGSIKRILVADSTIVKLHHSLESSFPGSRNQHAKTSQASARFQVLIDIFSGDFLHFNLSPFRRNDQGAAMDIISIIKKGDLILRDLGYFTLVSLRAIHLKGAFFITRHLYRTVLYNGKSEKIDILGHLREAQKSNLQKVRFPASLGKNNKIDVLVEVTRLPEHVAAERRRKARCNRDKRANYKADYYELLAWNIVITNIPETELKSIDAYGLYALRWRIENIFKAWKSNFISQNLSKHKTNVWHIKCLMVAQMIVLVQLSRMKVFQMCGENRIPLDGHNEAMTLSMFKVIDIMTLSLRVAHLLPDLNITLEKQLNYHAPYEKRNRKSLPAQAADFLA